MKIQAISAITAILYGLSGILQVAGAEVVHQLPDNSPERWLGNIEYDCDSEDKKHFTLKRDGCSVTISPHSQRNDMMTITNNGPGVAFKAIDSDGDVYTPYISQGQSHFITGRRFNVWIGRQ